MIIYIYIFIYIDAYWLVLVQQRLAVGTCLTYTYSPPMKVDRYNPWNLTASFHDWRESRDLEDFILVNAKECHVLIFGMTCQH